MADESRTIALDIADLPAFRSAIIACAQISERQDCERLLGQLASLEALAPSRTLRFIPGPSTGRLARRGLEHLWGQERLSDDAAQG